MLAITACAGGCAMEGVCDQITGRCLCPLYANKYVHENCSSGMNTFLLKMTYQNVFITGDGECLNRHLFKVVDF